MKEKKKKKLHLTKGSLTLRIIVSCYLIYAVYHLVLPMINGTAERTEIENLIIIFVIIIFSISALFLGITSVKTLIQKNHIDANTKIEEEVISESENLNNEVEKKDTEINN